nr:FxsA family protein [Falsochrobactrum sp. TDYN1]
MLAMPFIEIAGFVIIGSEIGVLATLGLIILSAMLGFFLLRVQGIGLLQRIRTETAAGRVPDREMVHGAMLVLAAILLIVPGFVTSAIGLLLFIPPIRDLVWERAVRGRMVVTATSTRYSQGYGRAQPRDDHVIDLDPEDYTDKGDENSPWNPDQKDR